MNKFIKVTLVALVAVIGLDTYACAWRGRCNGRCGGAFAAGFVGGMVATSICNQRYYGGYYGSCGTCLYPGHSVPVVPVAQPIVLTQETGYGVVPVSGQTTTVIPSQQVVTTPPQVVTTTEAAEPLVGAGVNVLGIKVGASIGGGTITRRTLVPAQTTVVPTTTVVSQPCVQYTPAVVQRVGW